MITISFNRQLLSDRGVIPPAGEVKKKQTQDDPLKALQVTKETEQKKQPVKLANEKYSSWLNGSKPTQIELESLGAEVRSIQKLLEKPERCCKTLSERVHQPIYGGRHLGCFRKSENRFARWVNLNNCSALNTSPAQACVDMCKANEAAFAGVSLTRCLCDSEVDRIVEPMNGYDCPRKTGHTIACHPSPQSVDLYQLASGQKQGTGTQLKNHRLGCFRKPRVDAADFSQYNRGGSTAVQCFEICEQRGYTLTLHAPVGRGTCMCGKFTLEFNLKQKVDDLKCATSGGGEHVYVFKTAMEDVRCSGVSFTSRAYNRVALVSTPGSGNTWLRYLLEKSTGFFTGSRYTDVELFWGGHLGEAASGAVLIKDHMFQRWHMRRWYDAFVFLVRDPYESWVSNCYLKLTGGDHRGVVDSAEFRSRFFVGNSTNVGFIAQALAGSHKPVYLLFYEDLKKVTL